MSFDAEMHGVVRVVWEEGSEEPSSCLADLRFSFSPVVSLTVYAFVQTPSGTSHVLTTCVAWSLHPRGALVITLPTEREAF